MFIEKYWYSKKIHPILWLLLPFSVLFSVLTKLRLLLYKFNILKIKNLPVPVVVVGNISIGGTGKTPLVKHLILEVAKLNIKAGVILKGYRGSNNDKVQIVNINSSANKVGDEALIYALNGIKVAIGKNRYLAGLELLKAYPELQLIISDDGLQHYSLARDYEVIVIDGMRGVGNNCLLPMGPLREGIARLKKANAIVVTTSHKLTPNYLNSLMKCPITSKLNTLFLSQELKLVKIYNPVQNISRDLDFFKNKHITAMAGIGNPRRFFNFLIKCGINLHSSITFPDHYAYCQSDLEINTAVIMVTEKDYVKLMSFNDDRIWVVVVESHLNKESLVDQISKLINPTNK